MNVPIPAGVAPGLYLRRKDCSLIFGPIHGGAIDRALGVLETVAELTRVLEYAALEQDFDEPQLTLSDRQQFAMISAVRMLSDFASEELLTAIEPARRKLAETQRMDGAQPE